MAEREMKAKDRKGLAKALEIDHGKSREAVEPRRQLTMKKRPKARSVLEEHASGRRE